MAERRSKELLQLEHKGTPLSSLGLCLSSIEFVFLFFFFLGTHDEVVFVCAESALLLSGNKREADTQTRRLPSHGTPLTAPLPPSQRTVSNSSQVF